MQPETLLSTLHSFQTHDTFPSQPAHPFSSSSEQLSGHLRDLINATNQISNSLNVYLPTPVSNPKLVSLLRQHSAIAHTLHLSGQSTRQVIEALRKRSSINYGEDIPSDRTLIVDWVISRLESWGTSAGMEAFKDDGREGGISVVLGGKVLVIDVDFSVDRADLLLPKINVATVKTSYATLNSSAGSSSNTDGSTSLDAFLVKSIQNFCAEVQKDEELRDPQEAAKYGISISQQLQYLVMLDRLAERKVDGGLRWFVDIDQLSPVLEEFAKSESEVVASTLSVAQAPLDIFLLRSHALPLPYLTSPSISFLAYIAPRNYLTLLRRSQPTILQGDRVVPLDISSTQLRSYLSTYPQGVTIARLSLFAPSDPHPFRASMSMPNLTTRPIFSLVSKGAEIDHVFPQMMDVSSVMDTTSEWESQSGQHAWILDFTNGGNTSGVVMSQSKMRDVELIVNPLSGMDGIQSVGMMSFNTGSWIDLLLNPGITTTPERYTTLYISPSSLHPPLQLRLITPEEPGFILEKVPVHDIKEIWGVLEVVREQCWLNETISGCDWIVEDAQRTADELPVETEANEEDLHAALSGTLTPRKIPVNIFLTTHSNSADPLFTDIDSMSMSQEQLHHPRIIMTSPERPPISGLVEISVTYDETKPRGVAVEVSGAMGSDMKSDVLEEICRRGGTLGLSGRIWANAHGSP